MKLAKIAVFATVFLFQVRLFSQHSCGTDSYYADQLKKHPEYAQNEKEFNERAKQFATTPQSRAAVYNIPVVFHVIHTNGAENISREQLLDQIRVLNADFSLQNSNKSKIRAAFTSIAADCQIQFVLASIDPNGNCTEGINRVYSPLGVEVDQSSQEVKALIQWNYRKYLNIWVVSSIKSSGNGTILGYAQFPWMGQTSTDGIVIRHDRVGTIGTASQSDSGRTLTHEIGHWLGLYHTFQDGCNGGDLCDDTPPVDGAFTNANCPANGNSCHNDGPDLADMWEDYMDYSDGNCMAMFSLNQKTRMHGFLAQFPRNGNVSASNLLATGVTLSSTAPIANFSSSHKIVCAGIPVTFYDISCKAAVTARSWTLTGASIPSSTDANPVVVYQTPGKYKVSLLVQNGTGSNTKSVDEYIEVIAPNATLYPNFEEGFEVSDPAARGFISVSPKTWVVTELAARTGTSSFKAPVSIADAIGTNYSFVLPPVNLAAMANAGLKFTFYAAYAPSSTGSGEILRAFVSTDCGNSFTQILERSGTGLAYSGASATSNFVPSGSTQWKLLGITSLSSLGITNSANAIFRIDVISGQGNPVYVDNINISPFMAGVKDLNSRLNAEIYPNPAGEKATLEMDLALPGNVEIDLYDMAGRKVANIHSGTLSAGIQTMDIHRPEQAVSALYFVKIQTAEGQITKPITFAP